MICPITTTDATAWQAPTKRQQSLPRNHVVGVGEDAIVPADLIASCQRNRLAQATRRSLPAGEDLGQPIGHRTDWLLGCRSCYR